MVSLKGKVAVVTGASRGVGKGVALGLGEAGATVYVTGRSIKDKTDVEKLGGTVFSTAEDVTAIGGKGIAIPCDHRDDSQVEETFKRIAQESKRIDILVNNAWGGYEKMREGRAFTYFKPFWEQPFWRWDAMFDAGVRAAYTSSAFAARMMTKKKSGLIVNISFWSAQVYLSNTQYGVSKAAVDKMTEYMAHELKKYKVAVVALYPGLVRT
ncbi:MAG TPA: SDR family NAD(P)-dependent oxidoreductase, partial [Anaerolineales bacterium]|nr:SDR family NAD(P)-dependent oxidoreductase [Anaerolineales bacterium]